MKQIRALIKRIPLAERLVWRIRRFLPNAPVHGMTSIQEQNYFRQYAQSIYSGEGEIVDLGCWLGSTTIPLVKGLIDNPNERTREKRIHAYDLFVWAEWMDPFLSGCARHYFSGDSFLDEFKVRTRAYADRIKVYPGDLQQIGWGDEPIEFLLVDVMKSWDLARFVVENFCTKLIPEKALLLHQDFKHYYTPWIHLIQYRLRECFTFETDLANSASVVFRLNKPLDCDLGWLADLKSFSDTEVDDAFEYSMSLVSSKSSSNNIAAAKVMHFIHLDRIAEAKQALAHFVQDGFSMDSDLGICQRMLSTK